MRIVIVAFIALLLLGCVHTEQNVEQVGNKDEMLSVAEVVASMFNYYDEISPAVPNYFKGESELGGQCGDYALAFVNIWNASYPGKAMLVIQQQGIEQFPDGIYEVLGKDTQQLPFLKDRTTSMLYIWNNVAGIGHPELGGYKIRLVKEGYVKSHFGIRNWSNNGPHVWVVIDDVSIDPTYADFGTLPVIGYDSY